MADPWQQLLSTLDPTAAAPSPRSWPSERSHRFRLTDVAQGVDCQLPKLGRHASDDELVAFIGQIGYISTVEMAAVLRLSTSKTHDRLHRLMRVKLIEQHRGSWRAAVRPAAG